MAEWVVLRPIFDVCARYTSYEGRGKLWEPWWRHVATEKQLRVTFKKILTMERELRQQESGRDGWGEGGWGEGVTNSNGLEIGAGVSVCWYGDR